MTFRTESLIRQLAFVLGKAACLSLSSPTNCRPIGLSDGRLPHAPRMWA